MTREQFIERLKEKGYKEDLIKFELYTCEDCGIPYQEAINILEKGLDDGE